MVTTLDVYNKVVDLNVLPKCLTKIVAHYARSSDKKIIKTLLQARPFVYENIIIDNYLVTIGMRWSRDRNFVFADCTIILESQNPYRGDVQLFLPLSMQYMYFFQQFRELINRRTDPIEIRMMNMVYDSLFRTFSSTVNL